MQSNIDSLIEITRFSASAKLYIAQVKSKPSELDKTTNVKESAEVQTAVSINDIVEERRGTFISEISFKNSIGITKTKSKRHALTIGVLPQESLLYTPPLYNLKPLTTSNATLTGRTTPTACFSSSSAPFWQFDK